MDRVELLKDIRQIITRGWTKGSLAKNDFGQATLWTSKGATCFCLLGAFVKAKSKDGLEFDEFGHGSEFATLMSPALPAFQAIIDQDPYRGWALAESNLVQWNDAPERTKKEVLAVIDENIKYWESKE